MTTTAPEQVALAVTEDRLEDAAAALRDWLQTRSARHADEAAVLHAEARQLRDAARREELEALPLAKAKRALARRIMDLRRLALDLAPAAAPAPAVSAVASGAVFMSYNHADADVARSVRDTLASAGITTLLDEHDMQPGDDIAGFVRRSVAATRTTVCLVSRASLLSAWVAQETLLALAAPHQDSGRRFVALALDLDFMAPESWPALNADINDRLVHLQGLRMQRDAAGADSVDLDPAIARLHALRNGLPAVLKHLRESLCLDFGPAQRQHSLQRLLHSLQQR
jgi:TIR domain